MSGRTSPPWPVMMDLAARARAASDCRNAGVITDRDYTDALEALRKEAEAYSSGRETVYTAIYGDSCQAFEYDHDEGRWVRNSPLLWASSFHGPFHSGHNTEQIDGWLEKRPRPGDIAVFGAVGTIQKLIVVAATADPPE